MGHEYRSDPVTGALFVVACDGALGPVAVTAYRWRV
jgi:hypothetical protein